MVISPDIAFVAVAIVSVCLVTSKIVDKTCLPERPGHMEIKSVVEEAFYNLEKHSKRMEMEGVERLSDTQFEDHILGLIDVMIEHTGDRLYALYCLKAMMYRRVKGDI